MVVLSLCWVGGASLPPARTQSVPSNRNGVLDDRAQAENALPRFRRGERVSEERIITKSGIRFAEVSLARGVNFSLEHSPTASKFLVETMGGGAAFLDFNGDAVLDIFLVNGAEILASERKFDKSKPKYWNRLFQGSKSGTFTDVTVKAKVQGHGYGMGVAVGDYNNDGFPDLLVTNYGFNELFRNNGDGTFSEVATEAGVRAEGWCASAVFFDFDRDGHLDLLVTRYVDWSFENNPYCGRPESREYCAPTAFKGVPNLLFRNNGDGTFTDVSRRTGVGNLDGKSLGVAVEDFNRDGWLDLYIANDGRPCFLFLNIKGTGFEEVGLLSGAGVNQHGVPFAGMGVDAGDVNHDGLPEIFVTALSLEGHAFFENLGNANFEDISSRNEIFKLSYLLTGWGTKLVDLDNDGHRDILVVNGHFNDNVEHMIKMLGTVSYPQPMLLLRKVGSSFVDVSAEAGDAFQRTWIARGAAFGDFNNDGFVDVVVNHLGGRPLLLENRSGSVTKNSWLGLELNGEMSNRDAIGTQIMVTDDSGKTQFYLVGAGGSYLSSHDKRAIVGLGANKAVRVEIHWPSGQVQGLGALAPNSFHTFEENEKANR